MKKIFLPILTCLFLISCTTNIPDTSNIPDDTTGKETTNEDQTEQNPYTTFYEEGFMHSKCFIPTGNLQQDFHTLFPNGLGDIVCIDDYGYEVYYSPTVGLACKNNRMSYDEPLENGVRQICGVAYMEDSQPEDFEVRCYHTIFNSSTITNYKKLDIQKVEPPITFNGHTYDRKAIVYRDDYVHYFNFQNESSNNVYMEKSSLFYDGEIYCWNPHRTLIELMDSDTLSYKVYF